VGDRTVKVNLIAVTSGYVAGMNQASAATNALAANSAAKLAAQRQAFNLLGNAALGFGIAAAAATVVAIAKFAEFDKAMSNVNAVTEASAAEMNKLRDAALDAGGRTVYTAVEAANALEELAKAGFNTNQSIAGLDGTLDLAASGQLEVARASEIAATTVKQFNLEAEDTGRVADVLSAGANLALGSVEDLAQALKFVGPVAKGMGVSLEETTGALALFADQGVVGEQAGTTLRGVLASLTSPSSMAAKEIERLGINLYDSNGQFLGLANVAGQLKTALGDATDAERDFSLGVLFGNQQVTGARILVEAGSDSLERYTEQVDKSGFAAQVAAERLNNLSGDVEKLGGALDTALIKTGSGANDALRGLVQNLTFLVDAFADAPTPVQNTALVLTAVAAAAGLVTGGVLKAIPAIADFRAGLENLNISGGRLAATVGAIGAAVAVVSLVVGYAVNHMAEASTAADTFADSMDDATGSLTDYSRELVAKKLAEAGAFDSAKKLGVSQSELTDLVINGGSALDDYLAKLSDMANHSNPFEGIAASNAYNAISDTNDALVLGADRWRDQQAAMEAAEGPIEDNADALAKLEGKARDTEGAVDSLADQIRDFGAAQLDVNAATREFEAAVDDLSQSVIDNGTSLDVGTEAGRNNLAAIDDLAVGALDLAAATLAQTGNQEDANAKIAAGREQLILALGQFGIVGQAAEDYADSLGLIPANIDTYIQADTTGAAAAIQGFIDGYSGKTIYLNVETSYAYNSGSVGGIPQGNEVGGMYEGGVRAFANGGFPSGVYRGGQNIHKFAETGLPWETYISPKPGHERENIGYALESLARLGYNGSASSTSTTKVDVNVSGVEKETAAELVYQRLAAGLATQ
jgi:TP901 family phage tail tape measure protein